MSALNKKQKKSLLIYAAFILTIIFLHNPTGGYVNKLGIAVVEDYDYEKRTKIAQENGNICYQEYVSNQLSIGGPGWYVKKCEYEKPVIYWRSRSAMTLWLGDVLNVIWTIAFVSSIFFIVFFILKDKDSE